MMTSSPQYFTFVLGLCVFCACLVVLTGGGSAAAGGVKTLNAAEMVKYIQGRKFEPIDIILIPPFVMSEDEKSNYSVLSVMRFAPWARRIHVQDVNHKPSRDPVSYWEAERHSRLVHFHDENLLQYCATTPFLAELFVVVRPHVVLTNYVFGWQFFVNGSPVLRGCDTGLVARTRTTLNECAFLDDDAIRTIPDDYYRFSAIQGVKNGLIRFKDNEDHFIPPCSSAAVTSTRRLLTYDRNTIQSYFQFEEPHKNRDKPLRILVCVIANPHDDLVCFAPSEYLRTVQVWVLLTDLRDANARMSFVHRMIVSKNVFIEVIPAQFDRNTERMAADVMKQLHRLSNGEEFKVVNVFGYGVRSSDTRGSADATSRRLGNEVGNKVAQAYASPFAPFPHDASPADVKEWQRLKHL